MSIRESSRVLRSRNLGSAASKPSLVLGVLISLILAVGGCARGGRQGGSGDVPTGTGPATDDQSPETLAEGQRVFRFETFGNEAHWTEKAWMHEVVQKSVSPTAAIRAGLKVDAGAIPADLAEAIKGGKVDLGSPATTVTLLKLNAVVGLQGTVKMVDGKDRLVRLGITCALCHSTVDNSFSHGIGQRKDGWPNRDLNVGAIIAESPAIPPEKKAVYYSWGPGKYDPRFNIDGKSTPLMIPPAYGLAQVKNATYTGEGPISYWNAYVAVTQMHGQGEFSDPRMGLDIHHSPDLVGPKLAALRSYQHSLETPRPPPGSVDVEAAGRGGAVFNDRCAGCHTGATGTDNNSGALHEPSETGMDPGYAMRTVNKKYRTTPLRALWQHPPYFHDGSAQTLADVVEHYDRVRELRLTDEQKSDLVEYLKTL
ncbi:MAG TPA: c-type cytochrome [Planctomycetota bacterium]|nr:c-type cytochrome [Planctomycetota bacterium]